MPEENKNAAMAMSIAAQPQLSMPTMMSESASLMAVITKASSDPNTDVDKIERLMAMYERMEARSAKKEYAAAKVRLTAKLPRIKKRGQATGKNDVKTFKYAEWDDIDIIIRPLLVSEGFDLSFRVGDNTGRTTVTAILLHVGSHQEETTIFLPADKTGCKNDVQAIGSTVSYGKKYTAGPLLNLVYEDDDDDGRQAGSGRYIEDYQADQLLNLAEKAFAEPEKKAHLIARICKKFGIENITQMQVKDFGEACTLLNETITNVRAKAAEVAK